MLLWSVAGFLAGAHLIFFSAIALVALQLSWQIVTLDIRDPANCLRRFRSNRDVGAAMFLGLIADMALSWIAGLELEDHAFGRQAGRAAQALPSGAGSGRKRPATLMRSG